MYMGICWSLTKRLYISRQAIVLLDKTTCVFERESNDEIQPETAPTYLRYDVYTYYIL